MQEILKWLKTQMDTEDIEIYTEDRVAFMVAKTE